MGFHQSSLFASSLDVAAHDRCQYTGFAEGVAASSFLSRTGNCLRRGNDLVDIAPGAGLGVKRAFV
jgi:hypothetical protein